MMPQCTFSVYRSPKAHLGRILLAASDLGLCGVWFESQRHMPEAAHHAFSGSPVSDHPFLLQAREELDRYFSKPAKPFTFNVPLDLNQGTVFQQKVWLALLDIPLGQTVSYHYLAQRIGQPKAVRALGAAVGRNPISIVVPCHRVLGADGSLTGYAGGLERKKILLAGEVFPPEP
jgi:methylated-DNA-[protein]-cysteine S-methyltransferase